MWKEALVMYQKVLQTQYITKNNEENKQDQQAVYSSTSQTGFLEGQDSFTTVETKPVSKSLYDKLETRIKERQ